VKWLDHTARSSAARAGIEPQPSLKQAVSRYVTKRREFLLFLLCGGVNTGASYLVYVLGLRVLPYTVAYTVAYAAGIFLSYCLNAKVVFRRRLRLTAALKYPIVYLAQYVVGIALLYALIEFAGVSQLIAPVLVVVLTIPLTFHLSRYIINQPGRSDADVG
jgi:putative flippase GtrA